MDCIQNIEGVQNYFECFLEKAGLSSCYITSTHFKPWLKTAKGMPSVSNSAQVQQGWGEGWCGDGDGGGGVGGGGCSGGSQL